MWVKKISPPTRIKKKHGADEAADSDFARMSYYDDANGVPKTSDGRVTHLGVRRGELAAKIVTVGSASRAKILGNFLEDASEVVSPRGFSTRTGTFRGAKVSVVATGMGGPMMDFFVREARAVVDGPLFVVRLGTCGGVGLAPGTVVANTPGSYAIFRHPDAWLPGDGVREQPYVLTETVAPAVGLARAVGDALRRQEGLTVAEGLNASTDSFYSSQGRLLQCRNQIVYYVEICLGVDPNFEDKNHDWLRTLLMPNTASVEMESFTLLHLASCAARSPIHAATAAIVCADRVSGAVVDAHDLKAIERAAGLAVLEALAAAPH